MSVFLVFVTVRATLLHLSTYLVVCSNPSAGNVVQMRRLGQSGLLSGDGEDHSADRAGKPQLVSGDRAVQSSWCPHLL